MTSISKVPPDFEVAAKDDVLCVHRRAGDAEIYFLSNQENRNTVLTAAFRAGNRAPELWDPATGGIRTLPVFHIEADIVRIPLHFDPYGSAFIIFRGDRKPTDGKNWVKAHHDSIRGRIASEWRVNNGRVELNVTIPANTSATVYVPASNADQLTEGGKPLAKVKGVKLLRIEGDRAVLAVESGSYRFSTPASK